jgi:hypothetical protein
MDNGIAARIKERINAAPFGSIFTGADFSDIADNNTVRQCLSRLVNEGMIRRVLNGVYEKPKYSKLLNEFVAPDPDAVAKAIARTFHWTIAPSGNTALNLLGLSTQVSAVWSYISDGPYKTYEWNNTRLEFKHRTNKEISGLSYTSILVIQALKTLGKDNVTDDVITTLKKRLTPKEKRAALKESTESTNWVYQTIRKICEE